MKLSVSWAIMADFLGRYSINVLLLLAEGFETSLSKVDKVRAIIQAIVGASDYDEQFMKIYLELIAKEEVGRKRKTTRNRK